MVFATEGLKSTDEANTDKLKLFISYSRINMNIADRLVDELENRGFQVVIDRRNLPYGEEWQNELANLIHASDTIVWLISPHSVASKWCKWELAEVARLNKRLIPVSIEHVPPLELPEALGRVHILPSEGTFSFNEHFDILSAALNTNRAWIKDHTRLADRARERLVSEEPSAHLLRGIALKKAEIWKERTPKDERPSLEVLDLILASRQAATRRQGYWIGGLIVATLGAVTLANDALRQRDAAVSERERAQIAQSRFLTNTSRLINRSGDGSTAILVSLHALSDTELGRVRPYVPEAELALYSGLLNNQELRVLSGHTSAIMRIAEHHSESIFITSSRDGVLKIWNANTGEILNSITAHDGPVSTLKLTKFGKYTLTASTGTKAKVWQISTGQVIAEFSDHPNRITAADIRNDGKYVVTGDSVGFVRLWNVATQKIIKISDFHCMQARSSPSGFRPVCEITTTEFSPTRKVVVTGASDGTICMWDSVSGQLLMNFNQPISVGLLGGITAISFSSDGEFLAVGTTTGAVGLWDTSERAYVWAKEGHAVGSTITRIKFSADGKLLFTSGADSTARIWERSTGEELRVLRGHRGSITDLTLSPLGTLVATASADGSATIWDVASGKLLSVLRGHLGSINGISFNSNGTQLTTISSDSTVRMWSLRPTLMTLLRKEGTDEFTSILFDPSGSVVIAGHNNGNLTVHSASSGELVREFGGKVDELAAAIGKSLVTGIDINSSGTLIAASYGFHSALIWDAETGKLLGNLEGHSDRLMGIAFNPGGSSLVTASESGELWVWDATNYQILRKLGKYRNIIYRPSFSPEGDLIVAPSHDGTIRVWDANTSRRETIITAHDAAITGVLFAKNGTEFVSYSADATIKVWSRDSLTPLRSFRGRRRPIISAAISPNSKWLVTVANYGAVRLWHYESGESIVIETGMRRVRDVAFDHTSSKIALVSDKELVIMRMFPSLDDTVGYAKHVVPRCLTLTQQKNSFILSDKTDGPPLWCVSGPAKVSESNFHHWRPKWPYVATEWRDWLIGRNRGERRPLPQVR